MSQPESTIEMMKVIDRRYDSSVMMFAHMAKGSEKKSVVNDIFGVFKKTLKRMHKVNPGWTTMFHGSCVVDDDEMGNVRVMLITDVNQMCTGVSIPRNLMTVENIAHFQLPPGAVLVRSGDGGDIFFDQIECYGPDIVTDTLFPINFIGHAEQWGYRVYTCELKKITLPDGVEQAVIETLLIKRDHVIKITLNLSLVFNDLVDIYKSKKNKENG